MEWEVRENRAFFVAPPRARLPSPSCASHAIPYPKICTPLYMHMYMDVSEVRNIYSTLNSTKRVEVFKKRSEGRRSWASALNYDEREKKSPFFSFPFTRPLRECQFSSIFPLFCGRQKKNYVLQA